MTTEYFTAGVQYDDYKGTVAADDADFNSLQKYLDSKKLIKPDEALVGIEVWSGESKDRPITVRAFMFSSNGQTTIDDAIQAPGPLSVRAIELEMQPDEFFAFFKRFNIYMSSGKGMLDGVEITYNE